MYTPPSTRRVTAFFRTTAARLLPAVGLICLHARPAKAQVNVEVLRNDLKKSGFGGKIDTSFDTYLGNTQGSSAGLSTLLGVASEPHLAYLNGSGNYSHLGGETQVANAFLHVRYNLRLTSFMWGELFGQLESDRFRRIALRELAGIGPRFALVDTDQIGVYYGAAYMLEHTKLRADTEPIRPATVHRFSNYASIGISSSDDRVEFSQTIYYQPRFDAFDDYRLLSISSLDIEITDLITTGILATFRFEDPTPSGVERGDFSLKNTLGLQF